MLQAEHAVRITDGWPDAELRRDDVMLALHAKRSAASIAAWAEHHPGQGLGVVLTGTDLYRDILIDTAAMRSLELAQRLVVLQELGVQALPRELRQKADVIHQSVTQRSTLPKRQSRLLAVMVGHLREVKSPGTLFDAARLLTRERSIAIRHIGAEQEPGWADRARALERECPGYRWLGALPHARTRDWIQRAHVLVHTSAMEGGAHVIMEAVCSGTPVLASRVDGNVGMLGPGYQGYFEHGNSAQLARLLLLCREGQLSPNAPAGTLLARLAAQCAERAPLFTPRAEREALGTLVTRLQETT